MSTWNLTPTNPAGFGSGEFLIYLASNNAGTWVAGSNHNHVWVTNNEGTTWNGPIAVDAVDLTGLSGLAFLNGLFIGWGPSASSGNNIYTSPDGITWTERASHLNIALAGTENEGGGLGAAYLGGLYLIVGQDTGGGFTSVTSPDGITWTLQNVYSSASGGGFTGVTQDGTHFVATVDDASLSPNFQIAYSTDGANWTFQALNSVPGPNGATLGVYWFDSQYIVGWGYDASANGGLGQGWYEVATVLSPWNGATVDVNSSPTVGIQVYPLTADDGTNALGAALNPNDSVNTPVAIVTPDAASFTFEQTGMQGGEVGAIAYDSSLNAFMAVGNNSSPVNIAAIRSSNVTVPDIVGDTQPVANSTLIAANLTVGAVTDAYSDTVPIGEVISQAPVAGASVPPSSPIAYVLSLGPQFIPVPNVIGMSAALANETIDGAGLTVGTDTGVISTSIPIGSVATQDPVAGTLVLVGSAVNLGISFVSPVFDVDATVISQYANSPTLVTLVENFGQYFDPTANIQQFYIDVWNIDTAEGFGLDIWGRILGVSRVIPIPGTTNSFGFDNSDSPPDWENFGNVNDPTVGGPFFSGQIIGNSYKLNDDAYRTLLLTKAMANICATNAQALNALITNLFPGRGVCYTQDDGNMEMTYVFDFALTTIEEAILENSGVLSHPAGVGVSITVTP
jgi:hypothetical protein